MIRKLLVPLAAALLLGGCVTGYGYRAGAGDYYYGQPRTEYRYYDDSFGYYGSYGFGRYAPAYYYDRYGRLVYGGSYGYYGYPYGYGSQWWYRPRPHGNGHGGGDHGNGHGDHDADRDDRRPPWRNFGGGLPRGEHIAADGDDRVVKLAAALRGPVVDAVAKQRRVSIAASHEKPRRQRTCTVAFD